MRKRTSHAKTWALTIAIVLMSALILYWYIAKRDGQSSLTVIETSTSPGVTSVPPSPPLDTPEIPSETAPDTTAPEETQTENAKPDTETVTEAIDFLETLEEQSPSGKNVPTDGETGDSTSELTQEEMFRLVREGVSYYDSLVDSGSVDFFMQTSSNHVPENPIIQASNGTWEGTFAFSGNRFAGSVTENATDYNERLGPMNVSLTKEFAYDGETFEDLRETPNGRRLTRGNDMRYNPSHDPRFWGWNLSGDEPLVELIDTLNVEQIQSVNWDNEQVYHIQGTVDDAMDVELWLNPQKSYRPERFMFSTKGGEQKHQVIKDFDFIEVAPDLWFPQAAQSVTSLVNLETGTETQLDTITMHLTNIRINEPISSSRFSLEPPQGSTVFDTRTRESFTVE